MELYFLDSKEPLTKEQVGGKGYYLHNMAQDDLPIPEAAFLTTDLWKRWRKSPSKVEKELQEKLIPEMIAYFKSHNNNQMPLVSVRSAGAVSMPGMMDTILNVGINPSFFKEEGGSNSSKTTNKTADSKKTKAKKDENEDQEPFWADSCARFLTMYGETVLGMDKSLFDHNKKFKTLAEVDSHFEKIYKKNNKELPSHKVEDQIFKCILAVFESWDSERAQYYREINKIDNDAGTAVVIQRMVFGNKNDLSASGVLFSRNPSTGQNKLTGEYLINAQGEDVVSGSHTPTNLDELEDEIPEAYETLKKISEGLESKYKQMQDIEFTIEDGKVFILQARTAKCSPFAKLKMLMDLYKFNDISAQGVLDNLSLKEYLDLNVKQVNAAVAGPANGKGLPASMGAISGRVVFGPSSKYGSDPTIFVAKETTPNDLKAIQQADGILTGSGGVTSHAAVVARGMGKVCIVGCDDLKIKKGEESATLGGKTIQSGDWITMDAGQGLVWLGRDVPILDAQNTEIFWDLEDLVWKANPKWTRITSKVDELNKNQKTYFLTYALDSAEDDFLRDELKDATQYLNGVMDLTGKIDYMQTKYEGQFLFADIASENAFLRKKRILMTIPPDEVAEFDFEVYLGPYEADYASEFKMSGYKVKKQSEVGLSAKNTEASLILSQQIDNKLKPTQIAISSRNALLGVLK